MAHQRSVRSDHGPDEQRAAIADAAADAVFTIDGDGAVVECNRAAEEMFGYSREEAVGRPIADLIIPPDLRAAHWAGFARVAAGGASRILDRRTRLRGLRSDGSEIPIELLVTRTSGTPPLFTGFIQDLSSCDPVADRKEREQRLALASAQMAGLGGFEYDAESGELYWSEGMYELHGVEPGSFSPTPESFLELVHPDDRSAAEGLFDSLSHAPERTVEHPLDTDLRIVRPDGAVRIMSLRIRLVADGDGNCRRWVGTALDATDQRLVERALRAHDAVAGTLREWASFDEGMVALVKRLGDALELPLGALWVWDWEAERLVCRVFYAGPEIDGADVEEVARRTSRRPGEGLPGRAWESQQAIVAGDLLEELPPGRAREDADALALRSGVAFPAVGPDGPVAVLTFYGLEPSDVNAAGDRLARTLASIGHELGRFLERHRAELGRQRLTPRELQVLQLAAQGNIGREIAERLVVSPATVKSHFEHIYEKLGVRDRAAAVAQALRLGLIS